MKTILYQIKYFNLDGWYNVNNKLYRTYDEADNLVKKLEESGDYKYRITKVAVV